MTEPAVISRIEEGVAVAVLRGDIDMSNVEEIGLELGRVGLTSGLGLVVDLAATRYIDSAGVTMLFAVRQELQRSRLSFAVAIGDASPVRRLLKVTAFDEAVPTCVEVSEAVATVTRAAPSSA